MKCVRLLRAGTALSPAAGCFQLTSAPVSRRTFRIVRYPGYSLGAVIYRSPVEDTTIFQMFHATGSCHLGPPISEKLCKARSRLHQNRFLQPNTQFAAFVEIYKMCILLHLFLHCSKFRNFVDVVKRFFDFLLQILQFSRILIRIQFLH